MSLFLADLEREPSDLWPPRRGPMGRMWTDENLRLEAGCWQSLSLSPCSGDVVQVPVKSALHNFRIVNP